MYPPDSQESDRGPIHRTTNYPPASGDTGGIRTVLE